MTRYLLLVAALTGGFFAAQFYLAHWREPEPEFARFALRILAAILVTFTFGYWMGAKV